MPLDVHRILLFTKAPVPGRVKTRLAAHLGARGAAALYSRLAYRAAADLTTAGIGQVEIWAAPDARHPFFARCRRELGLPVYRQRGADLGARMSHALCDALRRGGRAVIVGADCVSLTPTQVADALACLDGHDMVFIPAEDGGYVLVGASVHHPGVFRRVPWGSGQVMRVSRRRLRECGVDWVESGTGWDLDRVEDLRRWRTMETAC